MGISRDATARQLAGLSDQRLTYTLEEAGRLLGLGRNAIYAAAHSGEVPTIRVGHKWLVPKAALHRLLGIGGEAA
jgi:excisionase family DNA binding protein